jgi:hypothetical protein
MVSRKGSTPFDKLRVNGTIQLAPQNFFSPLWRQSAIKVANFSHRHLFSPVIKRHPDRSNPLISATYQL